MGPLPPAPEGENWGELKFLRLADNETAVASVDITGQNPNPMSPHVRCLVYRAGRLTDIGTLGGEDCHPTDMNSRGFVVGYSTVSPAGAPLMFPSSDAHAFVWDGHRMADLNPKDALSSAAFGIDESNKIFGRIDYARYSILAFWEHGRIVRAGEASDELIGGTGLSRDGSSLVLIENMSNQGTIEPYVWKAGTFTPFSSPQIQFHASSINREGVVVGSIVRPAKATVADGERAAIYRHGRVETVGSAGAGDSVLEDLNDVGDGVGTVWRHSEPHAFVWAKGKVSDLSNELPGLQFLDCINNRGEMIGEGRGQGDTSTDQLWLLKPRTRIERSTSTIIREPERPRGSGVNYLRNHSGDD